MKTPFTAAACWLVLACGMQTANSPAIAQSTRTSVGDAGGNSASAGSRQLRFLCHAHRQRLSEWKAGGSPGRVSSPTSAVAIFPDDSPARYATEFEQLCAGIAEPDAVMLAELDAEREAVRIRFDSVQPPAPPQAWSNLPRRQAQGGTDVFDAAVQQQASGKDAQNRLAQPIPELSAQAIGQQSRPIDFVALVGSLAGALSTQDAGLRQSAVQQIAQQARTFTEGRDLSPSYSTAAAADGSTPGDPGSNAGSVSAGAVNPAGLPAGGRLSSQACEALLQSVVATKLPPNASATAAMETVMFMTKTEMDMIDGGCPPNPGVTPAQVAAARRERQQQYTTAEQNCNQIQSGGRRCVSANHFGPGATVGAGLQSPYPKIPVPIMERRR